MTATAMNTRKTNGILLRNRQIHGAENMFVAIIVKPLRDNTQSSPASWAPAVVSASTSYIHATMCQTFGRYECHYSKLAMALMFTRRPFLADKFLSISPRSTQ